MPSRFNLPIFVEWEVNPLVYRCSPFYHVWLLYMCGNKQQNSRWETSNQTIVTWPYHAPPLFNIKRDEMKCQAKAIPNPRIRHIYITHIWSATRNKRPNSHRHRQWRCTPNTHPISFVASPPVPEQQQKDGQKNHTWTQRANPYWQSSTNKNGI